MEEKTRGRHPTCGPVRCFFPFAWLPLRQVLYLLSLWPRAHQRVSQRGAQEWLVSFVPGSFPLWLPPKGCHQRHRDMRSTAWRGSWGGASRRGPRFSEGSWGSRFHPGFYLVDFLRCVSEKRQKQWRIPLVYQSTCYVSVVVFHTIQDTHLGARGGATRTCDEEVVLKTKPGSLVQEASLASDIEQPFKHWLKPKSFLRETLGRLGRIEFKFRTP